MPAADSAPGECFSVAHYRLLHHTAVSFVSSDISRRHDVIKTLKRANLMPAAYSAPGECFSVAHYRLKLHHTAVSFVASDIRVFVTCNQA